MELESNLERAIEAKRTSCQRAESARCETAQVESDQSLGRNEPEVKYLVSGWMRGNMKGKGWSIQLQPPTVTVLRA